jgi:hypothetical protein
MRTRLIDFGKNVYSQWGEDGILEKVFEEIGPGQICVEFGAWDGFHLSNTANLWTHGWKGVLIEGSQERYRLLKKNTEGHDVAAICRMVTHSGPDTLEAILRDQGLTDQVDLLSVDIDGDDYYIVESLKKLRPRVIVCEYNPRIPYFVDLRAEPGSRFGCSVAALMRLATDKGYTLVAITRTNCVFVRNAEVAKLAERYEVSVEQLAVWEDVNFVLSDYDGDYAVVGTGTETPQYSKPLPVSPHWVGVSEGNGGLHKGYGGAASSKGVASDQGTGRSVRVVGSGDGADERKAAKARAE